MPLKKTFICSIVPYLERQRRNIRTLKNVIMQRNDEKT